MKNIVIACRVSLVTLMLTGLVYPLAVTGTAQLLFPHQANGSLVRDNRGAVTGSMLIGQRFSKPFYFQGRPSAAGAGYDAARSGGSNLGPTSLTLRKRIMAETRRLLKENPAAQGPVPVELVTASASGLDPHLSPKAALWQIPRIAAARNANPADIEKLVQTLTETRDLGLFGEPRVNVLRANLALDRRFKHE